MSRFGETIGRAGLSTAAGLLVLFAVFADKEQVDDPESTQIPRHIFAQSLIAGGLTGALAYGGLSELARRRALQQTSDVLQAQQVLQEAKAGAPDTLQNEGTLYDALHAMNVRRFEELYPPED